MGHSKIKFYKAILTANSHLYFYSTEFLKTTTVHQILHNWALMFAVNGIKGDPSKKHLENLQNINYYCTPAIPRNVTSNSFLLNPVPEDTGAGKLSLMRVERFLPGSEFEFFIMSNNGEYPPNIISYGKKMSHHSLRCGCVNCEKKNISDIGWHEIKVEAIYKERIHARIERFINPLDFQKIENISYAKKHPMKPSPLYSIEGDFHDVIIFPQMGIIFPQQFPYEQWAK